MSVAQLDRASPSGGEGRGFESSQARQFRCLGAEIMSVYKYQAIDKLGVRVKAVMRAPNKEKALSKINDMGLTVIRCDFSFFGLLKILFKRKIGKEDVITFLSHIKYQAEIGTSITDSLTCSLDGGFSPEMTSVIEEIKLSFENGYGLSETLSKFRRVFGDTAIKLISVAEYTGDMSVCIKNAIEFLRLSDRATARVRQAVFLPIFSVFVAIVAIFCCAWLIVPQLISVQENFNVEYSWLSRLLIGLFSEQDDSHNIIWFSFFMVLAGLIFINKKYSYATDKYILRLPILGKILQKLELWRFTLAFSLALESNISPVEALEVGLGCLKNQYLKKCFLKASELTNLGYSLNDSFSKTCEFMPKILISAVAVGEKNNQLGQTMRSFADMTYLDIELGLKKLSNLLSIYLTIFTGVLLLSVVIGLFVPIYTNLLSNWGNV